MTGSRWSDKEIGILKATYPTTPKSEVCSLLPNRPYDSIRIKACSLGLRKILVGNQWSTYELDILKKNYPEIGGAVKDILPNRPIGGIRAKATSLGLRAPLNTKGQIKLPFLYRKSLTPSITEYQVILGTLLGDGHISPPDKRCNDSWNGLGWGHCTKQYSYLKFKASLLHRFHPRIHFDKKQHHYRCITKSFHYFHGLRKIWYPEGKKIIPDMVWNLGSLGLAIWYQDDGTYHPATGRVILCTQGFPKEDVLKLQELLDVKFDLPFKYWQSINSLGLPKKYVYDFFKIIHCHINECMRYKIGRWNY